MEIMSVCALKRHPPPSKKIPYIFCLSSFLMGEKQNEYSDVRFFLSIRPSFVFFYPFPYFTILQKFDLPKKWKSLEFQTSTKSLFKNDT